MKVQTNILKFSQVLIPGYGGGCASLALKMAVALEADVVVTTQRSEIKRKYSKKYGVHTANNPQCPFDAKKLLPKGQQVGNVVKLALNHSESPMLSQDGFDIDIIIDGIGGSSSTFGGLQLACVNHARIAFKFVAEPQAADRAAGISKWDG